MKKLLLLFVITTLFSCSDSDEPVVVPQEILGKWKFVEFITDYVEYDQDGNIIRYYITDGFEVEFKSNGTFTSNEENGFSGGNFTVNNDVFTMNYQNGVTILTKYRRFYSTSATELYLTPAIEMPINDETIFFDNYIMNKI
ncbi:MAG: hypothetical protein J0L86_10875 [Flavobacteriales bacterium]|nr:hypothetical protein [Flavobacteriales bacterium]